MGSETFMCLDFTLLERSHFRHFSSRLGCWASPCFTITGDNAAGHTIGPYWSRILSWSLCKTRVRILNYGSPNVSQYCEPSKGKTEVGSDFAQDMWLLWLLWLLQYDYYDYSRLFYKSFLIRCFLQCFPFFWFSGWGMGSTSRHTSKGWRAWAFDIAWRRPRTWQVGDSKMNEGAPSGRMWQE